MQCKQALAEVVAAVDGEVVLDLAVVGAVDEVHAQMN